jgi:DNA-binding XRE family transcriptional regulator
MLLYVQEVGMPRRNITEEAAPAAVVDVAVKLGRDIATARIRRQLREEDLATKAGITRTTLRRVEAGALGTGIGAYAAVLWALGMHHDLAEVAAPERDVEGQTLEAARRGERVRLPTRLSDEF